MEKSGKKPPVQILSQLFAGFLFGRVCQRVFGLEGFVRGGFCPFLLLSQYICYNRELNITLNFMFNMYDKKLYKRDVTCAWPPPCHKLSHLLGPPPPSSVTYFMDGPITVFTRQKIMIMIIDHFYSATLSTTTQRCSQLQHRYCIGVSRRSALATITTAL